MAISVIIGTYNSARYLRKVIDQVKDYDEVLIYDKGSTDDTVAIARDAGCTVLNMEDCGDDAFSSHNNAIHQAKNDWILFLRPNELAPKALKQYLDRFITTAGDAHGLFIPRRNFLMDKEDHNNYPDFQLRFFHRGGTIWNNDDQEVPSVYGRTERIPAHNRKFAIINIPGSINDCIGHLETSCVMPEGKPQKATLLQIMKATIGTFLGEYVMKGKFKYGTIGYMDSVNISMKEYYVLAKRHEQCVMKEINKRLQCTESENQ